jgi:GT2 family glycosyltransferase
VIPASAGPPTVSVAAIVVGTNERAWLPECLTTLCAACSDPSVRLRVYYVDNASADGSLEYVRQHYADVITIRNTTNIGFAAASNVGIRAALEAGADHVFLVNPDTSTPPDLITELARFMLDHPGYAIVGPMQWVFNPGEPVQPELNEWSKAAVADGEQHVLVRDLPSLRPHREPDVPRASGTLEFAYVQGAALYARSAALCQVGMFDETYHTFYEEVDLCRRARLAGWRVAIVTGLGIGHHGGGGTAGSVYRRRQMMRNKYYFLATDVEIPPAACARIALRWLGRDIRGRGIGGRSRWPVAVAETAAAAWWLLGRARAIAGRRDRDRALLAAGSERITPARRHLS